MQPEYVNDAYASQLEAAFNRLRNNYINIDVQAQVLAKKFTSSVDEVNRKRFYSALEASVGVNLQSILQNERLDDVLIATTRENVALIRSIPEEFFKKLETIVFTGTTQGSRAQSMIREIVALGHSTTKRAKLISRDQTSKLNSALSQQRQQNLGIEEYIWRTASDDRTRPSHASKNGKIFRWDSPPKDTGHPGRDVQCRCVAVPIIPV